MNYLQWIAAFAIGGISYTIGFYKGLGIGRFEGARVRRATMKAARNASN